MARMSPRHVSESVQVVTASTDAVGIPRLADEQTTVPCQVEAHLDLVATEVGSLVTGALTLRVPALDVDEVTLLAPGSKVTYQGHDSWVLKVEPVRRSGGRSYTKVTTGEMGSSTHGGGWPVSVTVISGRGLDKWGNPTPSTTRSTYGWIKSKDSSEPLDWSDAALTKAILGLPEGDRIASSDEVTVTGCPSQLAGTWRVLGDPAPIPGDGVIAALER